MKSPSTSIRNRAFTLIEVLVAIAILVTIIGLGLFMSLDVYRGFSHRSERDTVVSLLTKARSHAMANIYETSWGVCYISPNYIIFRGSTCTAGVSTNEVLAASPATVVNWPTAIVFTQLSGDSAGGTITLTQNAKTDTITINNEGTINW